MAVLKRDNAKPILGGAVVMDLADLRGEAEAILASAKLERDLIMREARAEAARLKASASDEGRIIGSEEGRAAGLAEGRAMGETAARDEVRAEFAARMQSIAERWEAAIPAWESAREALMRDTRAGAIRLALGIASRVLRRTFDVDPSVAVAQLEAALELLGRSTSIRVRCSLKDRDLVEAALPGLLERLGGARDAVVESDDSLRAGDIVVNAPEGGVDASLAVQLDRIVEALFPAPDGAPREPIP